MLSFLRYKTMLILVPSKGHLIILSKLQTDIGQIKLDPPPFYPIFDNVFFDKFYLIWASILPIDFLTKITGNNNILWKILQKTWNGTLKIGN